MTSEEQFEQNYSPKKRWPWPIFLTGIFALYLLFSVTIFLLSKTPVSWFFNQEASIFSYLIYLIFLFIPITIIKYSSSKSLRYFSTFIVCLTLLITLGGSYLFEEGRRPNYSYLRAEAEAKCGTYEEYRQLNPYSDSRVYFQCMNNFYRQQRGPLLWIYDHLVGYLSNVVVYPGGIVVLVGLAH